MMKYCALFLLTASFAFAADFNTGQAARLLIGQPNFTAQAIPDQDATKPNVLFASKTLLGAPGGVAAANNMLFVVDSNRMGASPVNNRILIYRNLSQQIPAIQTELPQRDGVRCPACVGAPDVVLGQKDFTTTDIALNQSGLREPTAVASDGQRLVVADTNNNRVLIWNSIPLTNGTPADVVVGQPDFTKGAAATTASGLRGPQGVWISGGKLFVADTQNHRVLIWNSIPTSNGAPANIALGQPDLNSGFTPNADILLTPKATNMSNPVSATSDGVRLYVADLGHSRVLVWNSIPTSNGAPADFAIGQANLTSYLANNSPDLCESNGKDADGKATYPVRCAATLEFPRFALSDGQRLFIADGGNDRILVYNTIPFTSGKAADSILGQLDPQASGVTEAFGTESVAASDQVRTPSSLAYDSGNLYVGDPYNRRVVIYSVGDQNLPPKGVRNAASQAVYAVGTVTFSGTIKADDEVTLHIGPDGEFGKDYKHKIVTDETFSNVVKVLVDAINAGNGDPYVFASPNPTLSQLILTARTPDEEGNSIAYSVKTSDSAVILATTGGATLAGGQNAAKIGPGALVTLYGEDFCDTTATVPAEVTVLPRELAGVRVYFDGIEAPLRMVSPKQITAQVPFEVSDSTSINAFVRSRRAGGRITESTPIAVPIVLQNPGIYAEDGKDPRPGVVYHASSRATGTISVDGTAAAGDIATVKIEDRSYSYTVKDGDTLASIRDALIVLINDDPKVEAYGAGVFTRIRLRARVPGPEGNGIEIGGSAPEAAQVIITATNSVLCCANVEGARVTAENPALPGETVFVYATGLGLVKPAEAQATVITGEQYTGPYYNEVNEFVSSLAGGKTANVLYAGLKTGTVGLYQVDLELNSDLPTNPLTQLTIAQDVYVSNIITFPLVNPNPAVVE